MKNKTNTERSLMAEAVIKDYCLLKGESFDDLESSIIDLITDLLHFAHQKEEIDESCLLQMAENHFVAETDTVSIA